jgi:hypothetical protein
MARGVQKHHKKCVCKKIGKSFDVSFFSTFFVLSRCRAFLSDGKNVLQKISPRKVLTKNSTKNPKPIFSRFLLSRFWRYSVRRVQKHDKEAGFQKNKTGPGHFLASDSPTYTTGVTSFVFWRPLVFGDL